MCFVNAQLSTLTRHCSCLKCLYLQCKVLFKCFLFFYKKKKRRKRIGGILTYTVSMLVFKSFVFVFLKFTYYVSMFFALCVYLRRVFIAKLNTYNVRVLFFFWRFKLALVDYLSLNFGFARTNTLPHLLSYKHFLRTSQPLFSLRLIT